MRQIVAADIGGTHARFAIATLDGATVRSGVSNSEPAAFSPPGLTRAIARCEGWTFGVL